MPCIPDTYQPMPPGLEGYWWESCEEVCVPLIISRSPVAFLSFLHLLESKGKRVFFPTVLSSRLARLLVIRGYKPHKFVDDLQGPVEGLVRLVKE